MVALPAGCLVTEGKTGQLPTMLFFQCCHVVFPYHRRRDTMTGGVLCNQCSIFFAEIIFKCSYLTWHSTEIDPAPIRQCFFHLRIAVSGNAALHILGTAKSSKLRKCFSAVCTTSKFSSNAAPNTMPPRRMISAAGTGKTAPEEEAGKSVSSLAYPVRNISISSYLRRCENGTFSCTKLQSSTFTHRLSDIKSRAHLAASELRFTGRLPYTYRSQYTY